MNSDKENAIDNLPDTSHFSVKGVSWQEVVDLRMKGLSHNQIAKVCGCSRQNVSYLLRQHGKGLEKVETFKKNRADILAVKQAEVLDSITPAKLVKMPPKDAAIAFGVLFDKERLERNQSSENIMTFSRFIVEDEDDL